MGCAGEALALQAGERLVLQAGRSGQQRPDGQRFRTAAPEQARLAGGGLIPGRSPRYRRSCRRGRWLRRQMSQQVLDGDGQFADPVAGRVVDGVGDGGAATPTCPISPTPLTPSGPVTWSSHLDEVDVDVGCVGVDRDEILTRGWCWPSRPRAVSMWLPSSSAWLIPHSMPPMSWLRAVLGLRTRPGANAPARCRHPDDAEVGVDGDLRRTGRRRSAARTGCPAAAGPSSPIASASVIRCRPIKAA